MKFSIITVCLNAGDDLNLTINSILEQTFNDFEIIIKDAFSKDGSIETIPKDKRIRVIQSKDNGIYDAMNQGIENSQGDYLIFMNAGDLFYDNSVLEHLNIEISKSQCEIYYGKNYCSDLKSFGNCPPYIDKYFCYRSMICHQSMVYRRDVIQNRKYDTEYKVAADKEWLIYALVKKEIKPRFVPIVIAEYKGQGFSETIKGQELNAAENKRLIDCYYTKNERFIYKIKYLLTLPHIRKLLIKNKRIHALYNKIVGFIYGT